MPDAQKAVKGIIEKVITATIKLTSEMRTISDGMQFSKEMTQQAVELLSSVLPQYQFEAAESDIEFNELKYEIEAKRSVVAKRRNVMKYILLPLVITAIIPYKHIPWASYVVLSVYASFVVTIVYCLLTWLVAWLLKAGKIGVSVGILPSVCLYDSSYLCIDCGPIPLPDFAMSFSLVQQNNKAWSVATIHVVLTILLGFAFGHFRDCLFESSSESVLNILPIHTYSIAAILVISCLFVSGFALFFNLERWERMYPQLKYYILFFWPSFLFGP